MESESASVTVHGVLLGAGGANDDAAIDKDLTLEVGVGSETSSMIKPMPPLALEDDGPEGGSV